MKAIDLFAGAGGFSTGALDANGLRLGGQYIHGLSYTPEYRAWQTMRLRCTVPTNPAYADYGGRGITVCERWIESPANFIADMGSKPSPAHELDRKDNDKGYSPENCRWVTRTVNDRNRRSNVMIEFRGETRAMVEWCEMLNIPQDTARYRMKNGWSIEDSLTKPVRDKAQNGHAKPKKYPCIECGARLTGSIRCQPCENKGRSARRKSAVVPLVASDVINAIKEAA